MENALLGGLFGAVLVFLGGQFLRYWEKRNRIRGNWAALYVEVSECGSKAKGYRAAKIKAPSYRLPTICYESCFASLLSDSGVSEAEAGTLLKFYSEVQTFNRGLDLADSARHSEDPKLLDAEVRRNCLKAERIAQPSGDYYVRALAICENGKSQARAAVFRR